jgi:hypothetical protein
MLGVRNLVDRLKTTTGRRVSLCWGVVKSVEVSSVIWIPALRAGAKRSGGRFGSCGPVDRIPLK